MNKDDSLDDEYDDSFSGWTYGLELKAFFEKNISANLSYSGYSLSDDNELESYKIILIDLNLAYHIDRFEIRVGYKRQNIKWDPGEDYDKLSLPFQQKYIGFGVYL